MRNVTIIRTKSSVACLATLKVYIEDPENQEITIDGTPCRKLGELKNGEERNFVVGDRAAKLYVIAGEFSKNVCNDFYPLPEGEGDIVLSGKCQYNPATGNAFRFDNNSDEAVKKNRNKGLKRGILIVAIAVVLGIAIRVLPNIKFTSDKDFTCEELQITLTSAFTEDDDISFTKMFYSDTIGVYVDRYDTAVATELKGASLEDFAAYTVYMYELGNLSLKQEGGLSYLELADHPRQDGAKMHHFFFLYQSDDVYWVVQFMTYESDAEKYREDVFDWAKTVTFKK